MTGNCIRHKMLPAAIILLWFSFSQAEEVARPVTVAGITDEPPMEYITNKSCPGGIYPELWKLWSAKTGIPYRYIIMKQHDALRGLNDGSVDVIMGFESPVKDSRLILSRTIYVSGIHIFSSDNIPAVEAISGLRPYITGVKFRDREKLRNSDPGIIQYNSGTVRELIESCGKGQINLFIAGSDAAGYFLKESGLWRKFTQSDKPVFYREIKAAVLSGNMGLLEKINSGFSMITEEEKHIISGTLSGGNIKYRVSRGYVMTVSLIILLIGGVAGFWIWNSQLQKRIERATEELKRMKDRAEAASIAKSRFLDNISHELRTPLTLMLSPVEEAINNRALEKDTLEMIRRNGRILLALINDLLDLSKMTAGKLKLNISETDLASEIKLYCDEIESAAAKRGLYIRCILHVTPVIAFVDRERFAHILSNFFSNSLKFTEKGGISVELKNEGENITLIFSDTGTGIPGNKIETVFDRFTQADPVDGKNYEGTGIGLSIVKEIVKLHGGTVAVESRFIDDYPDSHGTVFTVNIPAGKGHFVDRDDVVFTGNAGMKISSFINETDYVCAEGTAPEVAVPGDEEKPSILIVEDNMDMLKFLNALLSDTYNIYTAGNGREALEVLDRNESIDLVLSDILMPQMNGHELMEKVHADERFAGLPVLFLPAVSDNIMKNTNLELGAVDYIIKPFSPDELKLRIRNHMHLRIMRNCLLRRNEELSVKLKNFMDSRKTSLTQDTKRKMETVRAFIDEHYKEDITRELLASSIGMNPDIFSRMFNTHTGKTLPDYINGLRIEHAKKILCETDLTVSRIAIDTGYENIRTFNRAFKKITGMSPVEYRERKNYS
jgi:signal transduction histidine kinase/DNA-binding response OmpR family regulator